MRRRIAAVSRRAGARAASPPSASSRSIAEQLAIGRADRAAEVRLLRVQQPVQPGSHIAPDPMGLELEHAAVRADQPQERDDLLLSLQVDDVASASLRSEGPHAPARQARPGAPRPRCGRRRTNSTCGPAGPNEIEPEPSSTPRRKARRSQAGAASHDHVPSASRSSSTTRWCRAPTRARSGSTARGDATGMPEGAGQVHRGPGRRVVERAQRAVATSRAGRPISSARRSHARAGWMRASSPLTSPARSTATVRRRRPPGGRCAASAVARSGPPAGGA